LHLNNSVINSLASAIQDWRGEFAALLFGALLTLSFAPFNYFPLPFICLAVLFFIWQNTADLARIFLRGYLFGIGYFATGVSWVAVSMVRFGGMGLPLSIALTVLLVAFLALYIAFIGYLGNKYFSGISSRIRLLLVYPAMWVWLEWVRGWLFTGFPWIDVGYSQVSSPISGYYAVAGVYGVSLLVAICAGCLVQICCDTRTTIKKEGILLGIVFLCGGILMSVNWARPIGGPLKVSIIQGNIAQQVKWLPDQRKPTIDLYMRLTQQHWDSDIIIWPETALPVFFHQAKDFLVDLAQQAKSHHTSMLIGLPYLDSEQGHNRYYNSAVVLNDAGLSFYHKYHLVPFGEYVPLKWLLGDFLAFLHIPMADFSPSDKHAPVVAMSGLSAAISICYEDAFGEEIIDGIPKGNFLINISNDAWFGDSLAPYQHLQKAQVRTLETARPMLRSTNNGISAVIDNKAKLLAISPLFHQEVLTAEFQPMQGSTLYSLTGNYLVLAALLIMSVVGYRLPHRASNPI